MDFARTPLALGQKEAISQNAFRPIRSAPACPIFSPIQATPSGLLDLAKSIFPSDDSINPSIETDILNINFLIRPPSWSQFDSVSSPLSPEMRSYRFRRPGLFLSAQNTAVRVTEKIRT